MGNIEHTMVIYAKNASSKVYGQSKLGFLATVIISVNNSDRNYVIQKMKKYYKS